LGVLGEPLTHLCLQECESIVNEYDSNALHCEIASSGTRCSCCKPVVLVTLRGCHLLDGFVAWFHRSSQEDCARLRSSFVREIVLTPRGSRRATLVDHVIELPHLMVGSYGALWESSVVDTD
jgi:hypothetical protein